MSDIDLTTPSAHALRLAEGAVGKPFTVRTQRASATQSGVRVSGVVTRCEFVRYRLRGASMVAQFRVWINGHDPVLVESVPR